MGERENAHLKPFHYGWCFQESLRFSLIAFSQGVVNTGTKIVLVRKILNDKKVSIEI